MSCLAGRVHHGCRFIACHVVHMFVQREHVRSHYVVARLVHRRPPVVLGAVHCNRLCDVGACSATPPSPTTTSRVHACAPLFTHLSHFPLVYVKTNFPRALWGAQLPPPGCKQLAYTAKGVPQYFARIGYAKFRIWRDSTPLVANSAGSSNVDVRNRPWRADPGRLPTSSFGFPTVEFVLGSPMFVPFPAETLGHPAFELRVWVCWPPISRLGAAPRTYPSVACIMVLCRLLRAGCGQASQERFAAWSDGPFCSGCPSVVRSPLAGQGRRRGRL